MMDITGYFKVNVVGYEDYKNGSATEILYKVDESTIQITLEAANTSAPYVLVLQCRSLQQNMEI